MKKLNVICGMHFNKTKGKLVLNPKAYYWKVPENLMKKLGKGDIVRVETKLKDKFKLVPVIVVNIIEDFDNKDNLKLNNVVKIIDKVN